MGVPCVSSAQMKATSSPAARSARTYTSVCTASTRWPRWRLPFAYGRAMVTRVRAAIVLRPLLPRSADLREQAFGEEPRIGSGLEREISLRAEHERAPPVGTRPAPRSLVAEPGHERVGN